MVRGKNMAKLTYVSEQPDNDFQEKVEKIKKKLKECQKQKEEYLRGWQRCQADFINYRKRQEANMGELKINIQAEVFRDILQVLDSLNSAVKHSKPKKGREEISLIMDQLKKVLDRYNIKEIESVGEKFNPEIHEAIAQVESSKKSGIIIEEIQKGYTINNKLLRPAIVKVAK